MNKATEEQLNKLPKYAKDEIEQLRREVKHLRDELVAQQQQEPTRVEWGWRHMQEAHGYLKNHETLHFHLDMDRGCTMRVSMTRDAQRIKVNADGRLVIFCNSTNDAEIGVIL